MIYTEHFGFRGLPFENVHDSHFFFDTAEQARVRRRIAASIRSGRALTVLTGPTGAGKTTLGRTLMFELSPTYTCVWIGEPPDSSMELLRFLGSEIGISLSIPEQSFHMQEIRNALHLKHSSGIKCLLIVDEAHLMSDEILKCIQMLSNFTAGPAQLIQMLLLGQESFLKRINGSETEPFRQRIGTLESMDMMNTPGIRDYICHRIQAAGGHPSVFAETGWHAVERAFTCGGTPRTVNTLCDRSLSVAFEKDKRHVDVDDVYEAAQALGLQKEIFFYKVGLRHKERSIP